MQEAVLGHAHSTVKHKTLKSLKLVTQPLAADGGSPDGAPTIAIDNLGAGPGDRVVLTSDGAAVREMFGIQNSPVRWAVMGIID
ncbi:MAG: EutN/CcmL family microcompartment protein [Pirellulales bacterium]